MCWRKLPPNGLMNWEISSGELLIRPFAHTVVLHENNVIICMNTFLNIE